MKKEFRRQLKRELVLGVVVLLSCFAYMGCAARVKTVSNLPAGVSNSQVIEWDAAVANLERIASATSGARQSVIALNKAGAFPDGAAYAITISDIAKIDQAQIIAARFLETVPNSWGKGTQQAVSSYITEIQAAVSEITDTGLAGIKDQSSRNQVQAFTQTIAAAANLILGLIASPSTAASSEMRWDRGPWDAFRAKIPDGVFGSRILASSGAAGTFFRRSGACIYGACAS